MMVNGGAGTRGGPGTAQRSADIADRKSHPQMLTDRCRECKAPGSRNRVGGELTLTALPHHRTCGSAYGGSCLLYQLHSELRFVRRVACRSYANTPAPIETSGLYRYRGRPTAEPVASVLIVQRSRLTSPLMTGSALRCGQ